VKLILLKDNDPCGQGDSRGFTLVELVIAVTVVAVLTVTVVVGVSDINRNTQLSNAAARALADVRYAHELAMANRREVDIIVNVASNRYEIRWHDDGSYVPSPYGSGDAVTYFGTGQFSDITITSSQLSSRLSFNSYGTPLNGGSTFTEKLSIMLINSKVHVGILSSGYTGLEEVSTGGC
jgi:prepilin-type N-terminal cleavage/methylation domain-containing protein